MRFAVLLACTYLSLGASPLAANPIPGTPWGDVDLYADPVGWEEMIWDHAPGLLQVYVLQMWGPAGGSAGVHFSAARPACLTAQYLSDTCPFPVVIGNSQTGVAIAYGVCASYPIYVLTINYFGYGTTPECCCYWVGPPAGVPSGKIEASDCDFNVVTLTGGATFINPRPDGCPTSDESSTWGKVKSLYAE